MRLFAKWHIWLAWLTGIPILKWVVTGLIMVSKPIEEVRGTHLVKDVPAQNLPRDITIAVNLPAEWEKEVRSISGSVAKIVKLEHAWRRLDGRNDDGFQVAPFPG